MVLCGVNHLLVHVDDEDYQRVVDQTWSYRQTKQCFIEIIRRYCDEDGKKHTQTLQQFVLGITVGEPFQIKFKNACGWIHYRLNCRKSNLILKPHRTKLKQGYVTVSSSYVGRSMQLQIDDLKAERANEKRDLAKALEATTKGWMATIALARKSGGLDKETLAGILDALNGTIREINETVRKFRSPK